MEDIFKNAKFGDKFQTRSGEMAIYWHFSKAEYRLNIDLNTLILKHGTIECCNNGNIAEYDDKFSEYNERESEDEDDIVCRWEDRKTPVDSGNDEISKAYKEYWTEVHGECPLFINNHEEDLERNAFWGGFKAGSKKTNTDTYETKEK